MNLSYVIEKIKNAEFSNSPFKHIEVSNIFEDDDFEAIIQSSEITTNVAQDDEMLFHELFSHNYKIIDFPGCVVNYKEYIKWHADKKKSQKTSTACEGYGVVMRLKSPESRVISILQKFLNSDEFINCIAEKFNINTADCNYDAGIQKYLDGYEISPHPDIRKKALTFMVNINPSPNSSNEEHHTSYLQFKPERMYIQEFWNGNKEFDRCWVPWEWCKVTKQQRDNNSIVIFVPSNDTIHAVKANYNHLSYQRTQLYGNLWFKESFTEVTPRWEDFVINPSGRKSIKNDIRKLIPSRVKPAFKKIKRIFFTEKTHLKRKL